MADLIRNSELLQLFVDIFGKKKSVILKNAREHPQIISAEYTGGMLIINTTVDATPIILEVDLKD